MNHHDKIWTLIETQFEQFRIEKIIHDEDESPSKVYRAYDTHRRDYVIIKVVDHKGNQQAYERSKRELEIFKNYSGHKHIVEYYEDRELTIDDQHKLIMIVMEDMGGSLRDRFNAGTTETTNFEDILSIIDQVAKALIYLHGNAVIHRDIKLENILIDENNSVKLSDFGISKRIDDRSITRPGDPLHFSPGYTAPEIINGGNATQASDLFSLAVVFFEFLCRQKPPYPALDQCRDILLKETEGVISNLDSHIIDELLKALNPNSVKRHDSIQEFLDKIYVGRIIYRLQEIPGKNIRESKALVNDARRHIEKLLNHLGEGSIPFTNKAEPKPASGSGRITRGFAELLDNIKKYQPETAVNSIILGVIAGCITLIFSSSQAIALFSAITLVFGLVISNTVKKKIHKPHLDYVPLIMALIIIGTLLFFPQQINAIFAGWLSDQPPPSNDTASPTLPDVAAMVATGIRQTQTSEALTGTAAAIAAAPVVTSTPTPAVITNTPTITPTQSPTASHTPTPTNPPLPTPTPTPTETLTPTLTNTPTSTPTVTPIPLPPRLTLLNAQNDALEERGPNNTLFRLLRWQRPNQLTTLPSNWYYVVRFLDGKNAQTPFHTERVGFGTAYPINPNGNLLTIYWDINQLPIGSNACQPFWQAAIAMEDSSCRSGQIKDNHCLLNEYSEPQNIGTINPASVAPCSGGNNGGSSTGGDITWETPTP